jgi:hypothetical protein
MCRWSGFLRQYTHLGITVGYILSDGRADVKQLGELKF